jgi:hypothetical protein
MPRMALLPDPLLALLLRPLLRPLPGAAAVLPDPLLASLLRPPPGALSAAVLLPARRCDAEVCFKRDARKRAIEYPRHDLKVSIPCAYQGAPPYFWQSARGEPKRRRLAF